MNTTTYYSIAMMREVPELYYVPNPLLPKDVGDHLRGTSDEITEEQLKTIKKTEEISVFIIRSIQPFKSQPPCRGLDFVRKYRDTFQTYFNRAIFNYRQENNLPTPIHYEPNPKKNQLKKVFESSSDTVVCYPSLISLLDTEGAYLCKNNQEFFRSLLRQPLIDQISPNIQFFFVWQFLTNLILKKSSLEIKKAIYHHHCVLHRLVVISCIEASKKSPEVQIEFLTEQMKSINQTLNLLILCADGQGMAQKQLETLYQPLISWMKSLLKLKTSEARISQIIDWGTNIKCTVSELCVQVNQVSSSKEYLMRWVRQSVEVLNISLCSSSFPNAASYSSSMVKALFFQDFHELNRIVLEVKASLESSLGTFGAEDMVEDLDRYKNWLVLRSANSFLRLLATLIDRNIVHEVISKKMFYKTVDARNQIKNLVNTHTAVDLKPLHDWAIAIKKAKASPQFLIQLELLSGSWRNFKNLCGILSNNNFVNLFLNACEDSTDKTQMAKTYFEAVGEVNHLLENFYLCLNQINDQVAAFQALCLLIKSDKRLPQIETPILVKQFELMNNQLKDYIQPTVDMLNGFQRILQLDGGVKKISQMVPSELKLKFRSEEITVHLFAVDFQLYEQFDQEVSQVNEYVEAEVEDFEPDEEVMNPEPLIMIKNLSEDSFEKRIDEVFAPKKSEKIKKRLFEFLKQEKIDFKTLFGIGDHLKLYLNGRPIPLPKHTEWKPGTKNAIKREIIETLQ